MKENPGTSASISRSSASESDSDDEEETTSGSDTGGNDEVPPRVIPKLI